MRSMSPAISTSAWCAKISCGVRAMGLLLDVGRLRLVISMAQLRRFGQDRPPPPRLPRLPVDTGRLAGQQNAAVARRRAVLDVDESDLLGQLPQLADRPALARG